jgi:hypothetical protein
MRALKICAPGFAREVRHDAPMVRGGQHEESCCLVQQPFPCAADPHHGGVMVLVARFTRVPDQIQRRTQITPRLKVQHFILVEIRKMVANNRMLLLLLFLVKS